MVSEELRAMIPDYVRGLLSPAEAKEVEAALECTPEIYPEFEAAQSYYSALNQIPEVKAPAGFVERVNGRIDKVPLWPRVRGIFFEPLFIKLPLELAGLAACLVFSLIVFNPFSLRERFAAARAVAAAGPKTAVTAAEHKPAVVPAAEAAEDKTAAALAPEAPVEMQAPQPMPMPEPREPAVAAASQTAAKTDIPAGPAGFALAKAPEQKSPAIAEVRNNAARQETLADAMTEKKAETKQKAAAPEPAAAPARKPAAKAATVTPIEFIGSVDLSTDPLSSSSTEENAELILQTAASRCKRTMNDGKIAFDCTLQPDRLNLLIESLSRSFSVTTRLFPYDAASEQPVKVMFIMQ